MQACVSQQKERRNQMRPDSRSGGSRRGSSRRGGSSADGSSSDSLLDVLLGTQIQDMSVEQFVSELNTADDHACKPPPRKDVERSTTKGKNSQEPVRDVRHEKEEETPRTVASTTLQVCTHAC